MNTEISRKTAMLVATLIVAAFVGVWLKAYPDIKLMRSLRRQQLSTPFSNPNAEPYPDTFANPPPKEVTTAFNRASQRAKKLQDEALRLFKAKQFAKAEAVCSQAIWALGTINGRPINTSAMQLQGEIRLVQGRYGEALASFNQASQFNRSDAQALGKALAYLGLNNMPEARKQYTLAETEYLKLISTKNREYFRQILPGTKDENALKASIFFMRGNEKISSTWEEALENFEAAHQLVPRNFLIAFACGDASQRLKHYDDALRYYAITATFGKGEVAERAKRALNNYCYPPEREALMREAAKLR